MWKSCIWIGYSEELYGDSSWSNRRKHFELRHPSSRRLSKDGIVVLQGDLEASCTQSFVGTHCEDQVSRPNPKKIKGFACESRSQSNTGEMGSLTCTKCCSWKATFGPGRRLQAKAVLSSAMESDFWCTFLSHEKYRKMKTKSTCTKYQCA